MALVCEPQLVIADEPTTGLDANVQAQVLATIDRSIRATGSALLLISHDLSVVGSMTDDLVVFYGGVIVERGPTQAVIDRPLAPYTRALIASVGYLHGEASADVGSAPFWFGGDRCPFDADCTRPRHECRATPAALREVSAGRFVAAHVTDGLS
jgi:ABC-type dipeptide/oligopeptide/nickel transport system ATPase component